MKHQFKVESSKFKKCIEALSAVIMSKTRGEYFEPRAVIRKSNLPKEIKDDFLEDDSWIEYGVMNEYLEEVEYLGYKIGRQGMEMIKQVENTIYFKATKKNEKSHYERHKPKEFKFNIQTISMLIHAISELINIEDKTNIGLTIVKGITKLFEYCCN